MALMVRAQLPKGLLKVGAAGAFDFRAINHSEIILAIGHWPVFLNVLREVRPGNVRICAADWVVLALSCAQPPAQTAKANPAAIASSFVFISVCLDRSKPSDG